MIASKIQFVLPEKFVMKKYHYALIIPFFLFFMKMGANPTITFFFQPFSDIEKMSQKLRKPRNISKHTVNGIINYVPIAGILATYSGYITASDYNGEVIFPRKHQKSSVDIIVTPELTPVALFENTVHHWELIPGVPAAMYSCEQKYNDKTGQHYWETKEVNLPVDRKIPLASIVIIAKPKNIVIPSGVNQARETANLVLPPMYVVKGINIVANSMYMLTIRHLFKPLDSKNKREPFQLLTHVIE